MMASYGWVGPLLALMSMTLSKARLVRYTVPGWLVACCNVSLHPLWQEFVFLRVRAITLGLRVATTDWMMLQDGIGYVALV